MTDPVLHDMATRLEALLEKRMAVGGRGLGAKLRRAGRRLPKGVRRDLSVIVEAVGRSDHPKLARQNDLRRLRAAERRATAFLKSYDLADKRKGALLGMLGGLSFNLILLAVLVLGLLMMRGLV